METNDETNKETNMEKFLKIVSTKKSTLMDDVRWRIEHRDMLRASRNIALKILQRLDKLNMTKVDLAKEFGTDVRGISPLLSGSHNFDLETIVKLEKILKIKILSK